MSEELALATGARIYGSVPAVYINADGNKKSISAPGPGNYITMAKAMGLVRTLLGDKALQQHTTVQAHGSSTPHNRTTESKIFDHLAAAFGVDNWPVTAIKAHLGHSLAAASGDQLMAALGSFEYGIVPGIKTIERIADDVHQRRLAFAVQDMALDKGATQAVFLNSKGFGGNNATTAVLSPEVTTGYLQKRYGARQMQAYQDKLQIALTHAEDYRQRADKGQLQAIYEFGSNMIDEDRIETTPESMGIPGYRHVVNLALNEGFDHFK
jgi:acetoacetyl-[acyl-carrier protein] synthase